MNGTSGIQGVQSYSCGHHRIRSCTSNGLNSEKVPCTFSVLTISSLSPQASTQSEKRFLTPFSRSRSQGGLLGYILALTVCILILLQGPLLAAEDVFDLDGLLLAPEVVEVLGVEVTQGIQALSADPAVDNSVSLIKDKTTVVRVYLSEPFGGTGSLWIARTNGSGAWVQSGVTINPDPSGQETHGLPWSLDFEVPAYLTRGEGLAAGPLVLLPVQRTAYRNMTRLRCWKCNFVKSFPLYNSGPLRVRLVNIDYRKGNVIYGTDPPLPSTPLGIKSWLERTYPVNPDKLEVVSRTATLDLDSFRHPATNPINDYAQADCNTSNFFLRNVVRSNELHIFVFVNIVGTKFVRIQKPLPSWHPLYRTHYVGLVYDGGVTAPIYRKGCSDAVYTRKFPRAWNLEVYFSKVATAPIGPVGLQEPPWKGQLGNGLSGYWDSDGMYGDWYVGHELGHLLGLEHPAQPDPDRTICTPPSTHLNDDYPFPNGQLSGDTTYAGLDTGSYTGVKTALSGQAWHDMMTYCVRQWISSDSYEHIRCRLFVENGGSCLDLKIPFLKSERTIMLESPTEPIPQMLPELPSPHPIPESLTPPRASPPLPPPLVVPGNEAFQPPTGVPPHEPTVPVEKAVPPPGIVEPKLVVPYVSILAFVDVKAGRGDLQFVTVIPDPVAHTGQTDDRVQLRVTDTSGRTKTYDFDVPSSTGRLMAEGKPEWVEVAIPYDPKTAKLELLVKGTTKPADTFTVRERTLKLDNIELKLPEEDVPVSPVRKDRGATHKQRRAVFSWDVVLDQPPQEKVYFIVQMSFDGGDMWETVALLSRPELDLSLDRLDHANTVQLRVTASDGFNSTTIESGPLTVAPPKNLKEHSD